MTEKYTQKDGARLYEEDRARRMAHPEFRTIYEEEAAKMDPSLQLVGARMAAGLTPAEMAERMGALKHRSHGLKSEDMTSAPSTHCDAT